jgi:3'-5' exoribonuclease
MILEIEILHRHLAQMPEFPRPLQTLLEHLIISHHGRYEFGSPKLPMFPEALLLHYLDDLDSKLQGMQSLIAKEGLLEGDWTGYLPSLGRPLLKVQKFLEHPEAEPAQPTLELTPPLAPAEPKKVNIGDRSMYSDAAESDED